MLVKEGQVEGEIRKHLFISFLFVLILSWQTKNIYIMLMEKMLGHLSFLRLRNEVELHINYSLQFSFYIGVELTQNIWW